MMVETVYKYYIEFLAIFKLIQHFYIIFYSKVILIPRGE